MVPTAPREVAVAKAVSSLLRPAITEPLVVTLATIERETLRIRKVVDDTTAVAVLDTERVRVEAEVTEAKTEMVLVLIAVVKPMPVTEAAVWRPTLRMIDEMEVGAARNVCESCGADVKVQRPED